MAQKPMLCPHCRRLIGSEETVCCWCGTSRSNTWWRLIALTRGASDSDLVIKAILAANIVYYAVSLVLSVKLDGSIKFLSPGDNSLFLLGYTGTFPINSYGRVCTLVSANYLHGDIFHIIFNLIALRQIAPWAANEYGASRMFAIYTLGGVFGYVVSYLAAEYITLGASVAICSLIGSLLYCGRSRRGLYGSTVYREVSGWVISLFIFGLFYPGFSIWGHAGGIGGGIILGMLLGYNGRRNEGVIDHALALICAAITVAVLAWALQGALTSNIRIFLPPKA